MNLDSYATGEGLKLWTLINEVSYLDGDTADRLVKRARALLSIYDIDNGKEQFALLIHEAIYTVAELLYFQSLNARAINSPFIEEQIGSYRSRKGAQQTGATIGQDLISNNANVNAIITNLARNADYVQVARGPLYGELVVNHDPSYLRVADYCSGRSYSAYRNSGMSLYEWASTVYGAQNGCWSW